MAIASTKRAPARMMPVVLGFGAHHEAGHVLHEQERDALAVAAVDEVRHLLRALGVDDAAEARLLAGAALDQAALIGDHADGDALDARVAADHLAREVRLELVESCRRRRSPRSTACMSYDMR